MPADARASLVASDQSTDSADRPHIRQRISNELYERELVATGVIPEPPPEEPPKKIKKGKKGVTAPIEEEKKRPKLDDTEMREATFFRLESLGYRVGQGVMER